MMTTLQDQGDFSDSDSHASGYAGYSWAWSCRQCLQAHCRHRKIRFHFFWPTAKRSHENEKNNKIFARFALPHPSKPRPNRLLLGVTGPGFNTVLWRIWATKIRKPAHSHKRWHHSSFTIQFPLSASSSSSLFFFSLVLQSFLTILHIWHIHNSFIFIPGRGFFVSFTVNLSIFLLLETSRPGFSPCWRIH